MARETEYREIINLSDEDYTEEFKGQPLTIPARGSRTPNPVLRRREAVEFLAQWVGYDREREQGKKPLSCKPATRKPGDNVEVEPEPPKFKNPANGKEFSNKEDLDKDLEGFSHLRLRKEKDD